nr:protein kinase [Legionella jordanis]
MGTASKPSNTEQLDKKSSKQAKHSSKTTISFQDQQELKSYEVLHKLGKGAWGKVVKAKNVKTGTLKAIKIQKIDTKASDSKEIEASIKKEAKVGAHAGYTKALFFADSKKNPDRKKAYMVNEFYPGKDLKKLIQKKKYSSQEFLIIMRGIFSEMQRLHKLGIIHGDIKPANFIINKDLTVRAVDYGFASLDGDNAEESCGTPLYSAIELFTGVATNPVSDIYSVGITVAEGLNQVKREQLIVDNQETQIVRLRPNENLEKSLAQSCPQLSSKQVKILTEMIQKMTKQSPSQRLKPAQFAQMLATYDKEILQIPAVPQIIKNVAQLIDDIILMLEDRAQKAGPAEQKAIMKSLGSAQMSCDPKELKSPKNLYALKDKIAQASKEDCENFNFAREIMGDLRHIAKHRLSGNKFTASTATKVGDAFKKLVNRILPIEPWSNLSVSGSVAAARELVEERVQSNFKIG